MRVRLFCFCFFFSSFWLLNGLIYPSYSRTLNQIPGHARVFRSCTHPAECPIAVWSNFLHPLFSVGQASEKDRKVSFLESACGYVGLLKACFNSNRTIGICACSFIMVGPLTCLPTHVLLLSCFPLFSLFLPFLPSLLFNFSCPWVVIVISQFVPDVTHDFFLAWSRWFVVPLFGLLLCSS